MTTIEEIQKPIDLTAVDSIDALLDVTGDLLHNVVVCWSDLLFEKSIREQIREAWNDLDFNNKIEEKKLFLCMQGQLLEIEKVGLSGPQLSLKLTAVAGALSSFTSAPSPQKLLSVFDWILSILGSLVSVSSYFEKLKEFMEVLQKLIACA